MSALLSWSTRSYVRGSATASIGCAARRAGRARSGRSRPCGCRSPRRPRRRRARAALRSISTRSTCGSGNGATAPGAKPSPPRPRAPRAIAGLGRADGRRDLRGSARRSPGTSATTGAVADEDERLDDLAELGQPTARAASSAVAVPARTPRAAPRHPPPAGTRRRARRARASLAHERRVPARAKPYSARSSLSSGQRRDDRRHVGQQRRLEDRAYRVALPRRERADRRVGRALRGRRGGVRLRVRRPDVHRARRGDARRVRAGA